MDVKTLAQLLFKGAVTENPEQHIDAQHDLIAWINAAQQAAEGYDPEIDHDPHDAIAFLQEITEQLIHLRNMRREFLKRKPIRLHLLFTIANMGDHGPSLQDLHEGYHDGNPETQRLLEDELRKLVDKGIVTKNDDGYRIA